MIRCLLRVVYILIRIWAKRGIRFSFFFRVNKLSTLEEENGYLSKVKVDEVTGFVSHIWAKVPTHYAMPSWVVLLIKLLFDVGCNICKISKNLRIILTHCGNFIIFLSLKFYVKSIFRELKIIQSAILTHLEFQNFEFYEFLQKF